ncbi:MAG: tRNA (adenosine(37)-N6)-threonylcarbamoyltransferase complex ATPase subunit type 1 TsaE [Acidobacteriota bacterium]|nr:tRNA (adenosine(37)-N6)-threonylcarbamoyltransferase complex ATPase subunit type 1 TsaE [Acidobacteriota bacterium]
MKILYDIVTRSPAETLAFGRKLAAELAPLGVALLEGDLGSGKTTLTKGVVAGLGAAREEEVTSPSFTLVHEYRRTTGPAANGAAVFHVDLYRVEGAREAESLGLDDLFDAHSTVMIEWGDKLAEIPPGPVLRIRMEVVGEDQRRIVVEQLQGKNE